MYITAFADPRIECYLNELLKEGIIVTYMVQPWDDICTIEVRDGDISRRRDLCILDSKDSMIVKNTIRDLVNEVLNTKTEEQKIGSEPITPEPFNKEILVVQVGALLTKEKLEEVRQSIISQMSEGVVFIPPYMNAEILQVPKNVDVRVESTLDTHEFLEKDFIIGGN